MATFTQHVVRDVAALLRPVQQRYRIGKVCQWRQRQCSDPFYPHLLLKLCHTLNDSRLPMIKVEFKGENTDTWHTARTWCTKIYVSVVLVVGARHFVLSRNPGTKLWTYRMAPEEQQYFLDYEPEQNVYLSVTHYKPPEFAIE